MRYAGPTFLVASADRAETPFSLRDLARHGQLDLGSQLPQRQLQNVLGSRSFSPIY